MKIKGKELLKKVIVAIVAFSMMLSTCSPIGSVFANDKPAYLIDFSNAASSSFYTLTSVKSWGATNVSISFNYYMTGGDANDIYMIDISGGDFKDANSTDRYLKPGQNTYSYSGTANCGDGVMAVGMQVEGTSNAKVYIWDVVIKVNDSEDIFKTDASQLYTAGTRPTFTTMKYKDVPLPVPAYCIDFAGSAENAFYTLTSENNTPGDVKVSFDYYLTGGEDEKVYVMNAMGGKLIDGSNYSEYLQAGEHNFTYTGTDADGGLCVGVQADGTFEGKLYIWNVEITVEETSIFAADAEQKCTTTPLPSLTSMDKKDIKPAYKIDFQGALQNTFYTLSTVKGSGATSVSVSFKYYLKNADADDVYLIDISGGDLKDANSTNRYLQPGEHSYSYSGSDRCGDGVMAVGVQVNGTSNAELYIWDVDIKVNGSEDIFKVNASQLDQSASIPKMTQIIYDDIALPSNSVDNKPAYKIDFNEASGNTFYTLTSVKSWGATEVTVSFNYFLKNADANDIFLMDISGGDFKDANSTDRYLKPGQNSYSYSGTQGCSDGVMAVGVQVNGTSDAELYIWDVVIKVNGSEDVFKVDANQLDQSAKIPVLTEMLYGDIDFSDDSQEPGGSGQEPGGSGQEPGGEGQEPGGSGQEPGGEGQEPGGEGREPGGEGQEPTEKPAYLIKFKDATGNAFYTLSSVKGFGVTSVSISFNYYLKNADENDLYVMDISGGDIKDANSESRYLKPGQNSFSYSGTQGCADGVMAVGIQLNGTSEAELYIWDVVIKVNDSEELFKSDAKQLDEAREHIPTLTEMLYKDIVFEQDNDDQSGAGTGGSTQPAEKPAYLIDYKGASYNSFYTLTSVVGSGAKNAKISFKYYLTNAKEKSVYVINIAGGHIKDDTSKSEYLKEGKGSFSYEGPVTNVNGTIAVGIQEATTSEAKLYIWDVSVTVDGKEIFKSDAKQLCENGTAPKMTVMKYKDIKFTSGGTGSAGSSNGITAKKDGKYMLLQKNYCHVEGKGALQYQEFMQFVGEKFNGSVIKGNTEYVLSFDYYGDPGDVGTGVSSAVVQVKTLYTGYNETFNAANQCILWNEDKQSYQPYILPATGYYHIEVPFKTLENQTDLLVGLQSGFDGDAYYWNFSLVEKNGNGKNLLTTTDFAYSDFKTIVGFINGLKNYKMWGVSQDSLNAKGTYSFVPFVEDYANLQPGETVDNGMGNVDDDWGNEEPVVDVPEDVVEEETSSFPWFLISIIAVVVLGGGAVATVFIIKKKRAKASVDLSE